MNGQYYCLKFVNFDTLKLYLGIVW